MSDGWCLNSRLDSGSNLDKIVIRQGSRPHTVPHSENTRLSYYSLSFRSIVCFPHIEANLARRY
jgi:hypothetical protein